MKKPSRVEVAKLRSRIGREEKNYKILIYLDLFLVSIVNARGNDKSYESDQCRLKVSCLAVIYSAMRGRGREGEGEGKNSEILISFDLFLVLIIGA